MQKVKIQNELSNHDYSNFTFFKYIIFEFLFELNLSNYKVYMYILLSIIIVIITIVDKIYYKNAKDLKKFKKYVKDCKDLVKYDRKKKYINILIFQFVSLHLIWNIISRKIY